MATNFQFSVAVHILAGLAKAGKPVTSGYIAKSVNTSPSFVRRVLARLSHAGLAKTATGKAGACWLGRNPKDITLLDVYRAVEAPRAFAIHDYPESPACPVSRRIKTALGSALDQVQEGMDSGLRDIRITDILAEIDRK